jgi:tRNA pseudouridine55 synthase
VQLSRLKSGNFSLQRALSWETLQKIPDANALLPSLLTLPEVSRLRRQ